MADIRIKLTKSLIGSKQEQDRHRPLSWPAEVGNETVQPNNDATQGKIKKIAHLMTVVEE